MKPTAGHIERLLAAIERRIGPPARRMLRLPPVYDPGGLSKKKALAKLAADYPKKYAGLTVEDLPWIDDLPALQAKAKAEHLAAHPEDANCDFRSFIRVIVVRDGEPPYEDADGDDDVATSEATAVAASETSEPKPSETLGILSTPVPEPTDVAASEVPPASVVSMRDSPWRPSGRKSSWLAS
jgi:hypothetical protein